MFPVEVIMLVIIALLVIVFTLEVMTDLTGGFIVVGSMIVAVIISQIPNKEQLSGYERIEIHSTAGDYNRVSGTFYLGTGFIDSEELYKGNVFEDGMYSRLYIPVLKTDRIPTASLTDKAIYEKPRCINEPKWLFFDVEEFDCKKQRGKLHIPKTAVIKHIKFQ